MNTSEKILQLIRALPEDLAVDEVVDEMYLREKVEPGRKPAAAGDGRPREEFKRPSLAEAV